MRNFKKDHKERKHTTAGHRAFGFALRLKKLIVDCIGDPKVNSYRKKNKIPTFDGLTRIGGNSIAGWLNGIKAIKFPKDMMFLNMDPPSLSQEAKGMLNERGYSMTNYERSQFFRKGGNSKRLQKYRKRIMNHRKIDQRYAVAV